MRLACLYAAVLLPLQTAHSSPMTVGKRQHIPTHGIVIPQSSNASEMPQNASVYQTDGIAFHEIYRQKSTLTDTGRPYQHSVYNWLINSFLHRFHFVFLKSFICCFFRPKTSFLSAFYRHVYTLKKGSLPLYKRNLETF